MQGGDLPSGDGNEGCGTANDGTNLMLELRKRKQQLFFSSATLELWDWNDNIDVCLLLYLRVIRWSWHSQLLNVA